MEAFTPNKPNQPPTKKLEKLESQKRLENPK
jgi:hypothetical protein